MAANGDPRAVPAAGGTQTLKDIVILAVGGSEPKAEQLMDVFRERAIDTVDDLRICARRNRVTFSTEILDDVTNTRPKTRGVWLEYLERLLDGVLLAEAAASHESRASASLAPNSPASTSPGPKTSHFPWKHLRNLDPGHEHYWETLYVCFVAGTPQQREDLHCMCNLELSKGKSNYNYMRHIKSQNCRPLAGIYVVEPHENPIPVSPPADVVEKFATLTSAQLKNLFDQVHVNVSKLLSESLAPPAAASRDEAALPPPPVPEESVVENAGNFFSEAISLNGT